MVDTANRLRETYSRGGLGRFVLVQQPGRMHDCGLRAELDVGLVTLAERYAG
jgi:hypothetical protein